MLHDLIFDLILLPEVLTNVVQLSGLELTHRLWCHLPDFLPVVGRQMSQDLLTQLILGIDRFF